MEKAYVETICGTLFNVMCKEIATSRVIKTFKSEQDANDFVGMMRQNNSPNHYYVEKTDVIGAMDGKAYAEYKGIPSKEKEKSIDEQIKELYAEIDRLQKKRAYIAAREVMKSIPHLSRQEANLVSRLSDRLGPDLCPEDWNWR